MPRFLVQRTFPGGLALSANAAGAKACQTVVEQNSIHGVTWLHSYVSADLFSTVEVYDAPNFSAIHRAAESNGLPPGEVTQVTVLDPYFYTGATVGSR